MVPGGIESVRTGICIEGITTTIICMVAINGGGDGSVALACTCTVCAPCIGITKAIGAACAPTGTCGVAIITTVDLVGSGATATEKSAGISTDSVSTVGGQAAIGIMYAVIGICTDAIITITTFMAGTSGCGVVTDALACTGIVCAPCTAIIKGIGDVSGLTGICGVEIIITNAHAGSGAGTDVLHVIFTDFES